MAHTPDTRCFGKDVGKGVQNNNQLYALYYKIFVKNCELKMRIIGTIFALCIVSDRYSNQYTAFVTKGMRGGYEEDQNWRRPGFLGRQ